MTESTIDVFDGLFIVEGELDCLVLTQSGFRCVSLPGASYKLSPDEKDALKTAGEVYLAGDSDPVGQDTMQRLWKELGDRTFLIQWPSGVKDANQFFLETCSRNLEGFKYEIKRLVTAAKIKPMPNVYSLSESMENTTRINLEDHPDKLRFPWKSVDKMVNLMPGSVLSLFATQTGMGKTTWVMNVLIHEALRGEIVLNYSAELSIDEYSNLVAAHVLKRDRNALSKDDYKEAAKRIKDIKFYVGRNTDFTTASPVLDLIEEAVKKFGATTVCLDHLHFVCRNEQNPVQAQENAFQRLKNMAVKYRLKLIVVGQPRKANQQTKGKKVHITDAKGAEVFGSDADATIALHRELSTVTDPTNPPKEPYVPKTEVGLLKGRSQGSGPAYAELLFVGEYATFYEFISEVVSEENEGLF